MPILLAPLVHVKQYLTQLLTYGPDMSCNGQWINWRSCRGRGQWAQRKLNEVSVAVHTSGAPCLAVPGINRGTGRLVVLPAEYEGHVALLSAVGLCVG